MKDAHNDLSKVMRAPDIPSLGLRIEGLAFWDQTATDGMIALNYDKRYPTSTHMAHACQVVVYQS